MVTKSNMEFYTTAVLSTAHITKHDAEQLQLIASPVKTLEADEDRVNLSHDFYPLVIPYEYGWRIFIGEAEPSEEFSPNLRAHFFAAKEAGCRYLEFDQDGPIDELIPTFEW